MSKKFNFEEVYEVAKLIPRGRATSYGAISAYLGLKSGARMIGWAMNAAHQDKTIPAHRVVNRNGLLTGKHHFETAETMERKLLEEGIQVVDDRIVNFEDIFWDPGKELL
jgi:methylated-DNA-protein-cysteine methyltransferase related protein